MTPALTPAQRLALSRERLRLALHEPARAPDELISLLQGHPTAAVLAAAGLGALLVWLRPWRRAAAVSAWMGALLPGLLPVLGSVLAAVAKDQRWPAWCASWCSAATATDQAPAPFGAAQSEPGS